MIGLTLLVAFGFVVLAVSRKNAGAALAILIMSMMLWPEYIRVPFGLTQMSVPRLVAFALLAKFYFKGLHRGINFGKADRYVIYLWIWTIIANLLAGADFPQVSQMIGRGLDTVLMYFVARIALREESNVKEMFGVLWFTVIVMCVAGVYEAVRWTSPYHHFYSYLGRVARVEHADQQIRLGLLRAQVSTMVSIYFGMAMVMISGILWSIRGYIQKKMAFRIAMLAALLATLSSMSSGPWIGIAMVFGATIYYRKPHLIKPTLYFVLFCALFLEVASNRHFYNLIDYLALDKQTAWYRTRLLEVAFSQWSEFWLVGVGSNFPHHWGQLVDGRGMIDVVNNFLIIALYGGLPALFLYVSLHVIAIKRTMQAWRSGADVKRLKLLFGLAATLLAIDFSGMSVGLFGPALLLSYVLLGMIISASTVWGTPASQ